MASPAPQSRCGVYIGNVDRSVTMDMLKQVFCQCGTIVDCSMNGRETESHRYAFIDFANEDDRARAMKYDGFTLVGRKLRVAHSKGNVGQSSSSRRGSYNDGMGHRDDRQRQFLPQPLPPQATMEGGLNSAQQIESRLLLQFIQEGKMRPDQLSPAQQQLLIAALASSGAAPPQPMMPQPLYQPFLAPPPMMPQGYPMIQPQQRSPQPPSGYSERYAPQNWASAPPAAVTDVAPAAAAMMEAPSSSSMSPANLLPSPDLVRLRTKQHEQFFAVVRRDTEKYERKVREKAARAGSGGDGSGSSASDDDEKSAKRSRK